MIKKIISVVSLSVFITVSSVMDIYADSKYNKEIIDGNPKDISYKLNESVFKKADEIILISEKSIIDAISATPLAYAKDAPIITEKWKTISKKTKDYLKELGVKKITIIGGLAAISRTSEQKFEQMGIEVERIQGTDRYETSIKIAKELKKIKPFKDVIILSNRVDIKDAIGIYSYAAKENIPIVWGNDADISKTARYINKNKFDNIYAIGNSHSFISQINENIKEPTFVKEMKRSDSNIELIHKFYDKNKIDNMYLINAELEKNLNELDFISLGVVAAKQDMPILISGDVLSKQQSEFLDNINPDNLIEVGYEVEDYDLKKILTSKNFVSTIILIFLLITIYIRILKK